MSLMLWHLKGGGQDTTTTETTTPHLDKTWMRRASSNIGWGPMTTVKQEDQEQKNQPPTTEEEEPWTVIGSAIKVMALGLFWMGDNVNFLSSAGAFDNWNSSTSSDEEQLMKRRHQLSTLAGVRANQAYFAGAIAGLAVNWRTYFAFGRNEIRPAEARIKQVVVVEEEEEYPQEKDRMMQQLVKLQGKQFSLFLALLKVCSRLV
jgi:hypothetical protein